MDGEEIAIIIGALSALFASVIYAFKNIRESSCSWTSCNCKQSPETSVTEV